MYPPETEGACAQVYITGPKIGRLRLVSPSLSVFPSPGYILLAWAPSRGPEEKMVPRLAPPFFALDAYTPRSSKMLNAVAVARPKGSAKDRGARQFSAKFKIT